jgi:predicted MFS family arabinose efflux permease
MKPLFPMLAATTLARLVINSLRRAPYAIMTDLAAALGIPRQSLEYAMALQWGMGLLAPFFGPLIDRSPRKHIMIAAAAGFTLLTGGGTLATWLGGAVTVILGVIVLVGVCKIIFDPAMQAYISDHTPQSRRGFAIGVTETAWSFSLVIFAPLAAYLITNASVGALFAVISACGAAVTVLLWRLLPADAPPTRKTDAPRNNWGLLLSSRSAMMLLVAMACQSMSGEIIVIGYEAWFKATFALSVGALATLAIYISIAEFVGEFGVVGLADRVGRRRLGLVSLSACAVFCLILPQLGASLPLATAALVGMFIAFEMAIVAGISLATDVLPEARGTMMASLIGALAGSRAVGTIIGGALLRAGGFAVNGVVSTVLTIAAVLLIVGFVAEIRAPKH